MLIRLVLFLLYKELKINEIFSLQLFLYVRSVHSNNVRQILDTELKEEYVMFGIVVRIQDMDGVPNNF